MPCHSTLPCDLFRAAKLMETVNQQSFVIEKKILYTAWNTVYIFSSETVYKGCILHCTFFDVKAYTYREKYSHNQHT